MATKEFTKGETVILSNVRHPEFKGLAVTVLRYIKYCDSVDVLTSEGKRYRAFAANVSHKDADTGERDHLKAHLKAGEY